jgi:hypothetical protein
MAISTAWRNGLMLLVFNNTSYANVGDATGLRASSTAGSFYIALHTADPTVAGTQASSEATYTSYDRVAVARSNVGWTCSPGGLDGVVANAAAITFPACTGSSSTCTYFSVGVAGTAGNATVILYSGALTAPLAVTSGITPQFAAGALTVTES